MISEYNTFVDQLVQALAQGHPHQLQWVLLAYAGTGVLLWSLRGRGWALMYVAMIPFVNWSFSWAPTLHLPFAPAFGFNPVTVVTGLVLVVRDFAQREMEHKVLVAMACGVAWSFYYASPHIALASAIAFALAESVDWALFTFTRYSLSTRVMLSSLIAAPLDTTVFLYGAKFLTFPNWLMSVFGKLLGAYVVYETLRRQEKKSAFSDSEMEIEAET